LNGNCLLTHVDRIIEGKRRRGRRCNLLLNELKEHKSYWDLKEEASARI
jgi:hypothetical protein